ncbi:MAG TPA: DUF4041 domain-containing protein [Acidimicrobiales bacterium]|nr:DUF4041 domain-containing protein [Acidimicrobiales bacterium]
MNDGCCHGGTAALVPTVEHTTSSYAVLRRNTAQTTLEPVAAPSVGFGVTFHVYGPETRRALVRAREEEILQEVGVYDYHHRLEDSVGGSERPSVGTIDLRRWRSMSTGQVPNANWYPDPADSTRLRYWDGSRWTDHTAPAAPASTPPQPPVPPPPAPPAVASGTQGPGGSTTATGTGGFPEPPSRSRGGILGSRKALEAELEELRRTVDHFGYAEREALNNEIARLRSERDAMSTTAATIRAETAVLEARPAWTFPGSAGARRRAGPCMDGGAVQGITNWQVDGSVAKGRKMVNEISKLLLRAYNGEADVLVNKMRPYKLDAAIDQLDKARNTIVRLGATMRIAITDSFHQLRIEELRLTADFLAKKEEEKEAERVEKERLREEARARKEFEAEKARLLKEQSHYATALERLRQTGTPEEIVAAEARLAEIGDAIHGVEEREANIRAGYVYVISNFGAFGPGVVKIGMTRRLDPMDRIRELGDASVPFRYDVHALVFSEDAVSLENRLHQALANRRMNLVNQRREFFYATPTEVKALLTQADGSVLEFVEEPEADEWHQSQNSRRDAGITTPDRR